MINRLPYWFKQEIPHDTSLIKNILSELKDRKLNTVCVSAQCPNMNSCFKNNNVTFMIMGEDCSRNCKFCAVKKGPLKSLDVTEPSNIVRSIKSLNLRYVVITSVSRDDLPFGGASQFARTVYLVRRYCPQTRIEILIPDFKGSQDAVALVVKSSPHVIAHNLETVESFYPLVRPEANYYCSLEVLRKIKELGFAGYIKSGIMLGFGEKEFEVLKALKDLLSAGCDIVTLGQYLQPSRDHAKVREFVSLDKFEFYRKLALDLGFKQAVSGPLVRSSYRAEESYFETRSRNCLYDGVAYV